MHIILESIVIEGAKYFYNKNINVEKEILKIYISAAKSVINKMQELFGYELYFDEEIFIEKLNILFTTTNYHFCTKEDRKKILYKMISDNNIIMPNKNNLYPSEEYKSNQTKTFIEMFYNNIISESIKNNNLFKREMIEGIDAIKLDLQKLIEDKKILNSIYQEKEEYKSKYIELNKEYMVLKQELDSIRTKTKDNVNPLDKLLQENVTEKITNTISNEIIKAIEYYNNAKFNQAYDIFVKYEDILNLNIMFKYLYATTLYRLGRYNEAIEIYDMLCQPKNIIKFEREKIVKIYYFYGECSYKLKQLVKAYILFEKCYSLDQNFIDALIYLGITIWDISQNGEHSYNTNGLLQASKIFELACDKKPDSYSAHLNLASIQSLLGQIEDSILHFSAASVLAEDDEKRIDCYSGLMECYYMSENEEMVLKYMRKIENIFKQGYCYKTFSVGIQKYYFFRTLYFLDKDFDEWSKANKIIFENTGQNVVTEGTYHLEYTLGDKSVMKAVKRNNA